MIRRRAPSAVNEHHASPRLVPGWCSRVRPGRHDAASASVMIVPPTEILDRVWRPATPYSGDPGSLVGYRQLSLLRSSSSLAGRVPDSPSLPRVIVQPE